MGRVLIVRIRYQDPDSGNVHKVARDLYRDDFRASIYEASSSFQLLTAVAEYAEILRESYWAQDGDMEAVLSLAQRAGSELGEDEAISADVNEFLGLVERARGLVSEG